MKKSIIIDGTDLCTTHISGVSRYAYEIIAELDKLIDSNNDRYDIQLCLPSNKEAIIPPLKNIQKIELFSEGRGFRLNILRKYAKQIGGFVISFGPTIAYSRKQIVTIHDIRALEVKEYDNIKTRVFFICVLVSILFHRNIIVTVSNYQKRMIQKKGKISPKRIWVIGNGWNHLVNVISDDSIFSKFPNIKIDEYYYALGSVAKHKNYKWIYEVAKRNPDKQFVVAGNIDKNKWGITNDEFSLENIIFTGFVTDEENKALIERCVAFLHPSKYEGFGIPPMEALGMGKKVIISSATCLPEIYRGYATFFEPDDYEIDLDKMIKEKTKEPKELLEHYLWSNLAKKWLRLIDSINE